MFQGFLAGFPQDLKLWALLTEGRPGQKNV